ncbi:MAG: hypothetical protein JO121_25495, partial [Deltaproteobacteria bacterium]|nr:hypothetical protein [Deltaproteobacteria bacterium]
MLTRAFAAEVFAHGTPVVVSLPPLDAVATAGVLEQLAEFIYSSVPLEEALVRLQDRILAELKLGFEDALEIALDICFYAGVATIE